MALGYPNTGIPFEATYDPDAAFAHDEDGGFTPPPLPQMPAPRQDFANVGINEATSTMVVNGKQFHMDDHKSALESEGLLGGDSKPVPIPEGFTPLPAQAYHNYLNQIDDPSLGRMLKKNFGIGVDNLQLLGGRGLQFLGADELGGAIVDQQIKDLDYNEPYQRAFTDIKSAGDAGMWFAANLAQQGPNLIESALSVILGAAVGGVSGGLVGALIGGFGGLVMKFGGKEGLKRAAVAAAQKKLKGEPLDESEEALLSGLAVAQLSKQAVRRQKWVGGAAAGSLASNYGMGVADIYGEQVEAGTEDRLTTLGLAGIYAAAETLPEFVGLGYLTKGSGLVRGTKGNLLKKAKQVGVATTAGAAGEGATETVQEGLLISQNPDLTDEEIRLRLINSFAAGAGVGGAMSGGAAILRRGREITAQPLDLTGAGGPQLQDGQEQGELFPDLIGSYESDGRATPEELLAERDALLEERERLLRAQGGIYAEAAELMNRETSLADASVAEVMQMLAAQEGRFGQMDTILGQIDPALVEIDRRLLDPRYAELPPRAAAFADRMGAQSTLFDTPSTIGELPSDRQVNLLNRQIEQGADRGQFPSQPDSPVGPATFGYGDEQQAGVPLGAVTEQDVVTQDYLTAQPTPPPNTTMADAMAAAMAAAEEAQAAQQLAQQQAVQAQAQQAQQQQDDLFGPAERQQQEQQFQQAGAAPAAQMQFPAAMIGPNPVISQGEPTIMLPHKDPRTGQTVMAPVDVRTALEDSQQRIDALQALKKCLAGAA